MSGHRTFKSSGGLAPSGVDEEKQSWPFGDSNFGDELTTNDKKLKIRNCVGDMRSMCLNGDSNVCGSKLAYQLVYNCIHRPDVEK